MCKRAGPSRCLHMANSFRPSEHTISPEEATCQCVKLPVSAHRDASLESQRPLDEHAMLKTNRAKQRDQPSRESGLEKSPDRAHAHARCSAPGETPQGTAKEYLRTGEEALLNIIPHHPLVPNISLLLLSHSLFNSHSLFAPIILLLSISICLISYISISPDTLSTT